MQHEWLRRWLFPVGALALLAMGLFVAAYWLDLILLGHGATLADGWRHYLRLDADRLTDAISQVAPVTVAMLGIVVTVVAIIVQLAAGRFAGVARMFLRDRINLVVLAYYVIFGVYGLWLSVGLQGDFVPRLALLLALAGASLGLLLMLPYFAYVFWFLEPTNLVQRIRAGASRAVQRAASPGGHGKLNALQTDTLVALAELTDIASNSIHGKDKIIASHAVNAIKDFVCDYLALKPQLPDDWFAIGPAISANPDFVAMDPESLTDLEARRTWVEWQALRQYLGIYNDALVVMPDIDYLVAIDTRYIGIAAAERGDRRLIDLVHRFLNSYLRATLNARNVRTAYNVLNQYRLLNEGLLRRGRDVAAWNGVRHLSYYGHIGYDLNLSFVTETVGYDMASLCQAAHELASPEFARMLACFLELDRQPSARQQRTALLGVRKAQVKLAAYLLGVGDETHARAIAEDMKGEPVERLELIRSQLLAVESKDFWEIIDRGRNFEFMPEGQRAQLPQFFALVEEARRAA